MILSPMRFLLEQTRVWGLRCQGGPPNELPGKTRCRESLSSVACRREADTDMVDIRHPPELSREADGPSGGRE